MNRIIVVMLVLLLSACATTSRGPEPTIPAPKELRTDLYYGYYLTGSTQVDETINHVNLVWVGGPFGDETAISNMQKAQLPAIMDIATYVYAGEGRQRIAHPEREANLRALLFRLREANVLQYIAAFYPMDEPDLTVPLELDVLLVNESVRKVASEFPELNGVRLAVIYSTHGTPGFATYDWLAFDSYGEKSYILVDGTYERFASKLLPHQRTMLIPGGYKGQNPIPFFNFAQTDKRVVAVVPFLWRDIPAGDKGIGSQAIRQAYCLIGEKIKTPNKDGACVINPL